MSGNNTILKKKLLGEILVENAYITQAQKETALNEAKKVNKRIGEYLLDKRLVTEVQLAKALAIHFNLEFRDISQIVPAADALSQIPFEIANKYFLIPLAVENNLLQIAVNDPVNILNLGVAKKTMRYDYIVYISPQSQIVNLINRSYQSKNKDLSLPKTFHLPGAMGNTTTGKACTFKLADDTTILGKKVKVATPSSLVKVSNSSGEEGAIKENSGAIEENSEENKTAVSISLIINKIIERAISFHASDIHVEPDEDKLRIRERIDGILYEREIFPLEFSSLIASRLKVMGNLDITEKRISQDGRFNYIYNGSTVDFRLSTLPTIKGEKIVLRLLDMSNLKINLEELGMSEGMMKKVRALLMQPHGIILVTGPTGSGKTTTVYSMLNCINDIEKNIITIEDPVEYKFKIVNQVQVNVKVGLTFPVVLRTILRQDPNVIMIGEIRDRETANIAVRAALTGHLVISTLHTNDSLKTIDRLLDIGVEPYLIATSLQGIFAQRLIRKLCTRCKVEEDRETHLNFIPDSLKYLKNKQKIYRSRGCEICHNTGYIGRIALYEMLIPNSAISRAIKERASQEELYAIAKTDGFVSIYNTAFNYLFKGETSIDEVIHTVGTSDKYEEGDEKDLYHIDDSEKDAA